MAESVQSNCESREDANLILPLKESEFKPRLYNKICQYCGYTSSRKLSVDKHINSQHEMNIWYRCNYCKHTCVDGSKMQLHIKRHHKFHVNSEEIRNLIIDDPNEIDNLRRFHVEKRGLQIKRRYPIFKPIVKKDFKPRDNPWSCQYCDYTSQNKGSIDIHVNYAHEMIHWYQCTDCEYRSLSKPELRIHVIQCHNRCPTTSSLESTLIKDEEVVEHLKYMRIKKRIQKNRMKSMSSSKECASNFIPIEKANFKPRVNPKICPYCSYVGQQSYHIDEHVNCMHEMTRWFKCNECNFATINPQSFRQHLKNHHSITIKINNDTLQEFILKNQQEIEDLKRRRISIYINNGTLSKMQSVTQIKEEIEIEEHSVKEEDTITMSNTQSSMEAGLLDVKEEYLFDD